MLPTVPQPGTRVLALGLLKTQPTGTMLGGRVWPAPFNPSAVGLRLTLWHAGDFFLRWIYLICFLTVVGPCCCTRAFSSCRERGAALQLSVWASHCAGFSSCGAGARGHTGFSRRGSWALECELSRCGTQA